MKVLHFAYLNSSLANIGVVKQMQSEKKLLISDSFQYDIELWSGDDLPEYDVNHRIPIQYSSRFLRRFFVFKKIREMVKCYDVVIVRYAPVDIFSLFWDYSYKNIIFMHHTKEGEALKNNFNFPLNYFFCYLDNFISKFCHKRTLAIACVTNDILNYHIKRNSLPNNFPYLIHPNGICFRDDVKFYDLRSGSYKVVFVASYFFDWHGLRDVLYKMSLSKLVGVELHLVGVLQPRDIDFIQSLNLDGIIFTHGKVDSNYLNELFQSMDVGLSSFNLHSVNLKEACTLKVREYLTSGIPVYSGHVDVAFKSSFRFYKKTNEFDFDELIHFCMEMRHVKREEVYHSSREFIDKGLLTNKFLFNVKKL